MKYLNDEEGVSNLLKEPKKIKDITLTEDGAVVKTGRDTYFVGSERIQKLRPYNSKGERTIGALTGLDVFAPIAEAGYKAESSYAKFLDLQKPEKPERLDRPFYIV